MALIHVIFLFVAALLGGMINSVAGGGSFFTFPALILSGISSVVANATSTIALWPGTLASIQAYKKHFDYQSRLVVVLSLVSILGGAAGAITLLHIPSSIFDSFLPFLLLTATLIFTFSNKLKGIVSTPKTQTSSGYTVKSLLYISIAQLFISFYGGFFGGGIGMLMLATLGMMGIREIHQMNAIKVFLASIINGTAVLTFVLSGIVQWPSACIMILGAICGGYAGAKFAQKMNPAYVRGFVVFIGFGMTIYFFKVFLK